MSNAHFAATGERGLQNARCGCCQILDFSGGAADLMTVQPILKQPFFIGSGKTSQGQTKQFLIPDGATRLFLAPVTCAGCASSLYKASGSFTVNLSLVP